MSEIKVNILANGPLVVSGPVVIVDPQQNEIKIAEGDSAYLCRCGASKRKPFCDGEHHAVDFKAADAAPTD